MLTLGKGATCSYLQKVKLNKQSSTETELATGVMYVLEMLWLLYFIEAQGFKAKCTRLYQDNISAQILIKNKTN